MPPTYAISDGFDGAKAWSQDMRGRVDRPLNSDQVRAKRDADFYLPLDLKQQYAKMEVDSIERVNDRDTYVVVGTLQGELPDRLYFDTETGLLLRKQNVFAEPGGRLPIPGELWGLSGHGQRSEIPLPDHDVSGGPRRQDEHSFSQYDNTCHQSAGQRPIG